MLPFRAPNHPLCPAGLQRRSAAGFCRAPKHRHFLTAPMTARWRYPGGQDWRNLRFTMISRARAGGRSRHRDSCAGFGNIGGRGRICLSRRVRGGCIAGAPAPHRSREWAQQERPELWRCPAEQFEPNVHSERRFERKIRLTVASRHSGAAENGTDLSQPERPSAQRPRIWSGRPDCARAGRSSPRCCPSGDSICAAAGTGTGTAFFGAEENPHGHHPLRWVRANGYLGRGRPP